MKAIKIVGAEKKLIPVAANLCNTVPKIGEIGLIEVDRDRIEQSAELFKLFKYSQDLTENFQSKVDKDLFSFVQFHLHNSVSPPIQGELTKEKLDAAEVRMVTQRRYPELIYWLEQKGKKISPTFTVSFEVKFNQG